MNLTRIVCNLDSNLSKPSGSKITLINLPPGQKISARVPKHIAGNGPVYLRAKENLSVEVSTSRDKTSA